MGAVPSVPADSRARPIGVFDSGVGGLTVLHELLVALPQEDFVYLGDTARFPYGDRSSGELRAFALEIAELLLDHGAKLLVVACNSASAVALPALEELRAERGVDVIGVLAPAAQLAVETTHNGRVGLLATPATVESGAYARAVAAADPLVELLSVPCPDLAPLIQSDAPVTQEVVGLARGYCHRLRKAGVDTVILGCTHYPLVRPLLQRLLGREVRLVSAGQGVARRVEHALAVRGLESPRTDEGDYRFLCTGPTAAFHAQATRVLQLPVSQVERVRLGAGPGGRVHDGRGQGDPGHDGPGHGGPGRPRAVA